MKPSVFLRFGALAFLGVASSLLTSSILAQGKRAQAQRASVSGVNAFYNRVKVDPSAPPQPDPNAEAKRKVADQHLVASVNLQSMSAELKDGAVAISATASVQDRRPNWTYVWALSVWDVEGREVIGINYDRQIFSVPPGEPKTVTFNESVAVKPGSYTVHLKLIEARPGSDLTAIRTDQLSPYVAASAFRRVAIGE